MGFGQISIAITAALLFASDVHARSVETDAHGGIEVFVEHCFSPFLTGSTAANLLSRANVRYDFYDLAPFSDVAISPPRLDVTPGTDRRCEVSFDNDFAEPAATKVIIALGNEGITAPAPLPPGYLALPGTQLLAARFLNPVRVAVVHIGTRLGPNGTETFLNVERQQPQK